MSAPPFMKLYIAEYLAETTHLDAVGHGAYLLLIMAMWRAGGKLPRDDRKLSKIAQCSPDQWETVRDDVMEFFKVSGGTIRHSRVSKEIAKYDAVVDGASEAGKASASKRANKNKDKAPNVRSENVERKSNQREEEKELEPESKGSSHLVREDGSIDYDALKAKMVEAAGPCLDMTSTATHNLAPILALIRPGVGPPADFDIDVIPTIKARAARMPAGRTRGWAYFVAAIIDARDARLQGAPAMTERPNEQSTRPHQARPSSPGQARADARMEAGARLLAERRAARASASGDGGDGDRVVFLPGRGD